MIFLRSLNVLPDFGALSLRPQIIALRSLMLAILGLLLLATPPAMGQGVVISDTATILQNGVSFVSAFGLEGAGGEGSLISFTSLNGVSPTGNPSQFGSPTVLLEPNGNISDVFGVTSDNNFSFRSDFSETAGLSVDPVFGTDTTKFIFLAEGNGGPFDATKYLSTTLVDERFTATFQSDSDARAVPEPSTLILLGSGLAGLAGVTWRRHRRK